MGPAAWVLSVWFQGQHMSKTQSFSGLEGARTPPNVGIPSAVPLTPSAVWLSSMHLQGQEARSFLKAVTPISGPLCLSVALGKMQRHTFDLPSWELACLALSTRVSFFSSFWNQASCLPPFLLIQACMCLPVQDLGPEMIRHPWKVGLLMGVVRVASLPSFAMA